MLGALGVRPGWQRLSRWGKEGKQPGSWAVGLAGLPLLRIPSLPKPTAGWGDIRENGGLYTEGGAGYRGNRSLLTELQCGSPPGFLEVFSII